MPDLNVKFGGKYNTFEPDRGFDGYKYAGITVLTTYPAQP
jgi:hypothetical protein